MLKKHSVEGFEAFKSKVEELSKEETPLFVYFSGSKNSEGIVKSKCEMKMYLNILEFELGKGNRRFSP